MRRGDRPRCRWRRCPAPVAAPRTRNERRSIRSVMFPLWAVTGARCRRTHRACAGATGDPPKRCRAVGDGADVSPVHLDAGALCRRSSPSSAPSARSGRARTGTVSAVAWEIEAFRRSVGGLSPASVRAYSSDVERFSEWAAGGVPRARPTSTGSCSAAIWPSGHPPLLEGHHRPHRGVAPLLLPVVRQAGPHRRRPVDPPVGPVPRLAPTPGPRSRRARRAARAGRPRHPTARCALGRGPPGRRRARAALRERAPGGRAVRPGRRRPGPGPDGWSR